MNSETLIERKLLDYLGVKKVKVTNNSYLHKHHPQSPNSGNSHFKITVFDQKFYQLPKLESHKKIYDCLSQEMKTFIHALEIEIVNA